MPHDVTHAPLQVEDGKLPVKRDPEGAAYAMIEQMQNDRLKAAEKLEKQHADLKASRAMYALKAVEQVTRIQAHTRGRLSRANSEARGTRIRTPLPADEWINGDQ